MRNPVVIKAWCGWMWWEGGRFDARYTAKRCSKSCALKSGDKYGYVPVEIRHNPKSAARRARK